MLPSSPFPPRFPRLPPTPHPLTSIPTAPPSLFPSPPPNPASPPIQDVKASGNWMWAAKLPGQGALLYDACRALCDCMRHIGVAIDGGKDSLSMAARIGKETVKAPGYDNLVVFAGIKGVKIKNFFFINN